MNLEYIIKIGYSLGIKFEKMIICRAELIHLKHDGMRVKDIALLLATKDTTVYNWYSKQSLPNDDIIEKLESLYLKRIGIKIDFKNTEKIATQLGIANLCINH